MANATDIELRDVKYDVGFLGVKGSSYRHNGCDPRLKIFEDRVQIWENRPVYAAALTNKERKLNRVGAYGGIEALRSAMLPPSAPISSSSTLNFPRAGGDGGMDLPILVPMARFAGATACNAIVSLSQTSTNSTSTPQNIDADAAPGSLQVFVDWEMSHPTHKLQFDSPGFHIGVRGEWTSSNHPLTHSGVYLNMDGKLIQQALALVLEFDQELVKVALQRSWSNPKMDFIQHAKDRYGEIKGEELFGHAFTTTNFQDQLKAIAARVSNSPGLQRYYG